MESYNDDIHLDICEYNEVKFENSVQVAETF